MAVLTEISPPPPTPEKQCMGAPTYTTTHWNKAVNVDKTKYYIYCIGTSNKISV